MSTKVCSKCKLELDFSYFYKLTKSKDGYNYHCKNCSNNFNKNSYYKNKDLVLKKHAEYRINNKSNIVKSSIIYYKNNKDKILNSSREYYQNNSEHVRNRCKNHYENNRHLYRAKSAKRRCLERRAIPPWSDLQVIKEIYKERERISEETGIIHHVDHIIPLQGRLVCGLHVPNNLRIIPAKENLSKHVKFIEELVNEQIPSQNCS